MQITIDERLKLLTGLPIHVETFGKIKPKTLRQILEMGYTKYMSLLNLMTVTKEDLSSEFPEELSNFDVLFTFSDSNVHQNLKESFEYFLDDKVTFYREQGLIVVGNQDSKEDIRVIHHKNFDDIRYCIKLQNGLVNVDEDEQVITESDKAKEINERMKKAREEVNRVKKKEGIDDDSDFFDMISAITSKSNNINKLQILDYTMFQLYEEFKRICFIDQYDTNVKAMIGGAKNVKLKHWSSKIKF